MSFSAPFGGLNFGTRTPLNRGQYDIYPIDPAGIFANDTGLTNPNGRWRVVESDPLDGSFTWADGGAFTYTRGVQTGTAYFIYELLDYDGTGKTDSATVRITVE